VVIQQQQKLPFSDLLFLTNIHQRIVEKPSELSLLFSSSSEALTTVPQWTPTPHRHYCCW